MTSNPFEYVNTMATEYAEQAPPAARSLLALHDQSRILFGQLLIDGNSNERQVDACLYVATQLSSIAISFIERAKLIPGGAEKVRDLELEDLLT